MQFFGLEIMLMDRNIKWRCKSGRSSEDKVSTKKDKQYIIIFKSYMVRLPSTLSWNNLSILRLYVFFCPLVIKMDKDIKWSSDQMDIS